MKAKGVTTHNLRAMMTNEGKNVYELSLERPVLLIFLRHFGCTFCREALADIAQVRSTLEERGAKVVFVHMADDPTADQYFSRYQLGGATHVSDPACRHYTAFGLSKGAFTQLFGLQSWIRGFEAGILDGHGIGLRLGDGFQMPGVFVLSEGHIVNSFIHKLASERPDYLGLMAHSLDPTSECHC